MNRAARWILWSVSVCAIAACDGGEVVGDAALDVRGDVAIDVVRDGSNPIDVIALTDGIETGSGPDIVSVDTPAPDVVDASDVTMPSAIVDVSTLTGHLYMGYQGWFIAPGDGSAFGEWHHWSSGPTPANGNLTFDAWPDLAEYPAGDLVATALHYGDGSVAALFSAYQDSTVDLHMRWMRDYGIDGVHLQRFISELRDPRALAFRDTVTRHVRDGAERYGRGFAIMYDISGASAATVVDDIERDWMHMVDDLGVTTSDRYLHHHGRPVLGIWGFGFTDRVGTPAQAAQLIQWLTTDAPAQYRVTVIGGVPSRWRTLTADSSTDPAWAAVYRSYNVISPWLVGRYANDADVQSYARNVVVGDVAEATRVGRDYLPVVFPGFSWANLMHTTMFNQIPRRGGAFWWRQLYEWQGAGCNMVFGAMFDEVDEGTAMFKIASRRSDAPTDAQFLTLDADGTTLPSDWYLRLAGEGARMLRGEIARTATVPISP